MNRCIVLYDKAHTADLGQWVVSVMKERLALHFPEVEEIVGGEETFFRTVAATTAASSHAVHVDPTAAAAPTTSAGAGVTVVIVIYWDGLSESAKVSFGEFKAWASERKASVVVQALNAKKGQHTLTDNADALVSSLSKKLPPVAGVSAAKSQQQQQQQSAGADESAVVEPPTVESVAQRLRQGQGECFWVVSTSEDTFPGQVAELQAIAATLQCGMFPIVAEPREVTPKAAHGEASSCVQQMKWLAQEFMLRRRCELEHIEMRLAMCGNVDSGKSTITSVLTRGVRDDGRGLARAFVFNHQHEVNTGRTSSVSENHLGFDANGNVVNYDGKSAHAVTQLIAAEAQNESNNNNSDNAAAATSKHHHHQHMSLRDLAMESAKVVTLYDLAGHEKYLKTTVHGMTRSVPDYACIVISANNGIQRMTKEHLGLCLALKLPFFVVVTRIDATPENVRAETMMTINKLLKTPSVKKLPFPVKRPDDVIVAAKNLMHDRITPIFEVSNVTGQGIREVLQFINMLPVRNDWESLVTLPKEVIINSTFFVAGVGTVVGGIVTQGRFKANDTVWLGPDGLGVFRHTQIKSIHVKGVEVDHVDAGCDAAFCLKKEKRSAVRKGNVMLDTAPDPKIMPKSYWQFEAEIVILYHSTTIATNYEPVIHSTTVRQSARILLVEQEVLRTGDRAIVRFHFLYRPEYMKEGQRIIFREGRTKGIGTVTKLMETTDDAFLGSMKKSAKEMTRLIHQK